MNRSLAIALTLGAGVLVAGVARTQPTALRVPIEAEPIMWIEEGWFVRGSTEEDATRAIRQCQATARELGSDLGCSTWMLEVLAAELPQQQVHLPAFGIDRREVTRAHWQRCVDAGRCAPPRVVDARFGPQTPVTGVQLAEAEAFCRFAGGRVPSEAEWERAARGTEARRYAWGAQFNPRLVNGAGVLDGFRLAAPVGSFPGVTSPDGLLDVAGNVWEWTTSEWLPTGYAPREEAGAQVFVRPGTTPPPSTGRRATRGGGFGSHPHELRVTFRLPRLATEVSADLGFRCAYDPR